MQLFWNLSILFIIGLIGSVVTKQISENKLNIYWAIAPSIFSSLIWAKLSKLGHNLNFISVLFDIIYTLSYVVGFVMLGEPITFIQVLGIVVSLFGVYLMAM